MSHPNRLSLSPLIGRDMSQGLWRTSEAGSPAFRPDNPPTEPDPRPGPAQLHSLGCRCTDDTGFSGAQVPREYPMAVYGLGSCDSAPFPYLLTWLASFLIPLIDRIQPRATPPAPARGLCAGCAPTRLRGSTFRSAGPREQQLNPMLRMLRQQGKRTTVRELPGTYRLHTP